MTSPSTMLQRSPDACWGVIDGVEEDQLVLWSSSERRLRVLNHTAASVWNMFGRPRSQPELVEAMAETYGAPTATVEPDVVRLVDELVDAGFLCSSTDLRLSITDPARTSDPPRSFNADMMTIGPIQALGSSIMVSVTDPELHSGLSAILDPLTAPAAGIEADPPIEIVIERTGELFTVTRDGEVCTRSSNTEHILRSVLAEINSAPLDHVRSAVVLHAAGAAFPGATSATDESLVVFPGVSNAGKSTLVTQLCLRGHAYLTDEAVAIQVDSLEAQPFHKSICIEFSGQKVLSELADVAPSPTLSKTWDIDPRQVGSGRLAHAGPIAAIVFPRFSHGATTNIEPLEPFEALQRLIANAFDFSSVGQPAFRALVRLANAVPAFALDHGGDGTQLDELEHLSGSFQNFVV